MSYSRRTCHKCGYKDIQPNMKQIEVEYQSGTSQKAISTGAVVGHLLGDKRSSRQIGDAIFGTSKRKYKRNRKVWVCADGCREKPRKINAEQQTVTSNGAVASKRRSRTLSLDQEALRQSIEHYETMFGELNVYMKRFSDLIQNKKNISKLDDAECRVMDQDLSEVTWDIKHELVSLGRIYKDDVNKPNFANKAKTIILKIINILLILWGIFTFSIVVIF